MSAIAMTGGTRFAVLVDRDTASPEILAFDLRAVAQFGRVVAAPN
ncbi:MAG: hypothetical protein Q7K41_02985 [Dehalococcoidales bacterium]|nr:hypothetical protein [Dehalococcoidales bacterium]